MMRTSTGLVISCAIGLAGCATTVPRERSAVPSPAQALRSMSLDERCAVMGLLAVQLVEMMEWQRAFDQFVNGDAASLVVFIDGGEAKLVLDEEACEPKAVPLLLGRPARVQVTLAGVERAGPTLVLWLDAKRSDPRAGRYTFVWPRNRTYSGNPPRTDTSAPYARVGAATGGHAAPRMEIELARRGDVLVVLRSGLEMWTRSAPAR